MKISIPRIKTIRPKRFEMSEVRQHLAKYTEGFTARTESPIIGYALVTFHADGGCGTSWHSQNMPHATLDLPDMVRNRLRDAQTRRPQ